MQDLRKESQQLKLTEAGVTNSDSKALPEQNIDSSSHRKTVYKSVEVSLLVCASFTAVCISIGHWWSCWLLSQSSRMPRLSIGRRSWSSCVWRYISVCIAHYLCACLGQLHPLCLAAAHTQTAWGAEAGPGLSHDLQATLPPTVQVCH